jgi:hypothetical protein
MSQGTTEINLVFRDWLENFAPKTLIESDRNMVLIAEYIGTKRQGIVTTTTLNQAVTALGNQLEYKKVPSPIEKAFTADANALKRNLNARSEAFTQKRVVTVEDKAVEKELQGIKDEISREINSFSVASHGFPNYARTESGQKALRDVLAQHDTRTVGNAKLALSAVRMAKGRL